MPASFTRASRDIAAIGSFPAIPNAVILNNLGAAVVASAQDLVLASNVLHHMTKAIAEAEVARDAAFAAYDDAKEAGMTLDIDHCDPDAVAVAAKKTAEAKDAYDAAEVACDVAKDVYDAAYDIYINAVVPYELAMADFNYAAVQNNVIADLVGILAAPGHNVVAHVLVMVGAVNNLNAARALVESAMNAYNFDYNAAYYAFYDAAADSAFPIIGDAATA